MSREIIQKIPSEKEIVSKLYNSAISTPTGMGSACDLSIGAQAIYDQPFTFIEQLRQSETLYFSDWQSKKIIDIPVDDMLREGWIYKGLSDEDVKLVIAYQDQLDMLRIFREALKLERLHGGSAIFLGLADDVDDPNLPIDYSDISEGSLRYLNAVPRHRINRVVIQTDPTLPDYGNPSHYIINGKSVHRSRLLIFDGDPLLPVRTLTLASVIQMPNDGFGAPILMRLFNSLTQATGSRQAAFHLIQRASTLVFSGNLQTQLSTVSSEDNVAILNQLLQNINNYNAAILNNEPGSTSTLETLAANFGSVPELVMSYLQVLSAASDIPATRFLGQAPGGLNATGQSDLENYYNMIRAHQKHRLTPNLKKILQLILPSLGLNVSAKQIDIEYVPLWNMSDTEEAQIRQIDTQNITSLVTTGIISDDEAYEELRLRGVLMTNEDDFERPENLLEDNQFDPQQKLQDLKDFVGKKDASNTSSEG